MSSRRQLPKRTQLNLAACAAVGLSYWAQHPLSGHVWAIDDSDRTAHVVRICTNDNTARHVCGEVPVVAVDQCAGNSVAMSYQPPPAA